MKRCWWWMLLCVVGVASAEVSQQLRYDYYNVKPRAGETLMSALSRSSDIRQGGNIFHGYTRWSVYWYYKVEKTANRLCRLDEIRVEIEGRITLPQLDGGTASMRRRFNEYAAALHRHELGHFAFAQQAGEEIDRALQRTAEAGCRELKNQANDSAYRILNRYQQQEDAYDRETQHGRTQGAWLGGD